MKQHWTVFLFILCQMWLPAQQEAVLLQEAALTEAAFHQVTFQVDGIVSGSRWLLHMFDEQGRLLYDGCLEKDWQAVQAGQAEYRHAFLRPAGAVKLQLLIRPNGKTAPRLTAFELAAVTAESLVLNADFALGASNYSGWEDRYQASFQEDEKGLHLLVRQNGYALTGFFPVQPGGGYDLIKDAKGWPGVTFLTYDRDRHFLGIASRDHRRKPSISMPSAAAYARILFETSHDHIPAFCSNRIDFTGLKAAEGETAAALTEPSPEYPEIEIILQPGCDPREEHAARELQHWITRISGKCPMLLAKPSTRNNLKIHAGTAFAEKFPDDRQFLQGSDGYAIRKQGKHLYVFAVQPRGILYGVYALLEKNAAIIWPRPNPEFEVFFQAEANLQFRQTDFRSRPVFQLREISRGGYGHQNKAYVFQNWQGRNGLNPHLPLHTGFNYPVWVQGATLGYGGSHRSWIGSAVQDDENFFPLIDGVRDKSIWRQPCYSYEKTAEVIAQNIRERIALLPGKELEYLMSTLADNWSVCACENCMKPIRLADGSLLEPKSPYAVKDPLFFSTRNFQMLNRVAELLAADFPKLRLLTHAYIFAAEPPKIKVHPAIIPQYAAYPTRNERFPILSGKGAKISSYEPDVWARRFREWSQVKPDGLGIFGYYYTPCYNALADTAAADYRALAEFGGIYGHTEGFPVDGEELSEWDMDAIEKWVIAKLLWDPKQDPAELREQYIGKVYGEAAVPMREFHQLIVKIWHEADEDFFVNCHSATAPLFREFFIKTRLVPKARGLLVQAEKMAREPQRRVLLQRMLKKFDQLQSSLGQHRVPAVEESTQEWTEVSSTHWEKSLLFKNFMKVSDWRSFARDTAAEQQTQASFMQDGEFLYIRVQAFDSDPSAVVVVPFQQQPCFPNGDRVELLFGTRPRLYVALGPNGTFYSRPELSQWRHQVVKQSDGWVALMAIPFKELPFDNQSGLLPMRVGRVFRLRGEEREESSFNGASLYNNHESFWANLQMEGKNE